ncbi:MAG: hypothetical protein K1X66_05645 [Verrucomicrobiae bacterium]|nr:hypothetical protein [Verrucomicrobiae bacterium]
MQRIVSALILVAILAIALGYGWHYYQQQRELVDIGIAEEELNNCPALMDEAAIRSVKLYHQLENAVSRGNLKIVKRNAKTLSTYLSKINPEASVAAQKLAQVSDKNQASNEFQKFDQLLEPKTRKQNPNIQVLP